MTVVGAIVGPVLAEALLVSRPPATDIMVGTLRPKSSHRYRGSV